MDKNAKLIFMKTPSATLEAFPDRAEIAALRAWYEGLGSQEAVARYLPNKMADGASSRKILSRIRKQLAALAQAKHQSDLAVLFRHREVDRAKVARAAVAGMGILQNLPILVPMLGDAIERWFSPRTARALGAFGIHTLADLRVRMPQRSMWWLEIPGLGLTNARKIEGFFAKNPHLAPQTGGELVPLQTNPSPAVVPWEVLHLPMEMDGTKGTYRAPLSACTLDARNDYEAVQAWLSLHESPATLRTYRKEAERLILWAIWERGRALSSLTVEDAVAYRAFLRQPVPESRWVGPAQPRTSAAWKPFVGPLAARSVAHALSVLGALFRWLMEQGYLLANPFAGVKVRGGARQSVIDTSHVFSAGEWELIRTVADGLEHAYGWAPPAAQRLRFILDFAYATGLRASELVGVTLQSIHMDGNDSYWIQVLGKGAKMGKVALPPLALSALERNLGQRQLPLAPQLWVPSTPLIATLEQDGKTGITASRLWVIFRRFFRDAANKIAPDSPALAQKLQRASPHWMRHTHATHALAGGADLTTVRDNLRHASLSTTSLYLHSDDTKRAQQMGAAFMPKD